MFKVNNRNTRTWCEICSKLTMKTPERRQASLLLTLNIFHTFSSVFIVNFEQVNAGQYKGAKVEIFTTVLQKDKSNPAVLGRRYSHIETS